MNSEKWRIYDELLASVPEGETVKAVRRGNFWLLLESSGGGCGLAQNITGDESWPLDDCLGRPLKEVAGRIKSWDFNQAAVGLAAVNAAHNRPEVAAAARAGDAFDSFLSGMAGKKVAVIGRFPWLEKMAPRCRSLIVLERNPGPGDLPDTAAEYVLPEQDVVFITATTLINKTLPRLLDLGRGARVALVGPSTPMTPLMFRHGLSALSGLVVTEPATVAGVIAESGSCIGLFAKGVAKVNLTRPEG